MTPRAVEINGARLYLERSGSGRDVVFLHAGIADSRMWDREFASYALRYGVIRYDARGFGRSTLPSGPYSWAEDLRVLLDHLEVEQAALVGSSMGGSTALTFALEHPERTGALVLVAPGIDDHQDSEDLRSAEEEEEAAFHRGDEEAVVDVNVRTWVVGPHRWATDVSEEVLAKVRDMLRTAFRTQFAANRHDPPLGPSTRPDPPAGARLGEISVPTLIVIGRHDVADAHEIAARVARDVPAAETVTIEDAAHLPNLERPAEFDAAVLGFLARVW